MAIPVEYIGKQRRWLQAGVPTERANQSMHESSLVVSIANVHPSATIQTVANAKPIVREPRDRGRSVPQESAMRNDQTENEVTPKRRTWVAAVPRFVGVAFVSWTLLAMAVMVLIPLDYPTEQADVDAATPWVFAFLVVGTLSLATLDTIQYRRRTLKEAQNNGLDAEASKASLGNG